MRFSVLAVAAFMAGAFAVPAREALQKRYTVHEKRDRLPARWVQGPKLDDNAVLPVRIALTQNNLDQLEGYLMDVSHPSSPHYGKHWSADEIADAFAPTSETIETVKDWLVEGGVSRWHIKLSQSRSWMHADMTVKQAEELLQTSYYEFFHASGHSTIACKEYSIPESIREHIDFITPTVHFDAQVRGPNKQRRRRRDMSGAGTYVQSGVANRIGFPGSGTLPKFGGQPDFKTFLEEELEYCNETIVPDCLRVLYDIPVDFPANPKNSYGIVEYTPQAYVQSDLDLFFANFSPALVGKSPKLDSIDGGFIQTFDTGFGYNGESNLDLEYAMTLSYPQLITLYQVGDPIMGASFNNFLDALDASYCTYEGGDDPTQDGIYPDNSTSPLAYKGPENCGGFAATYVVSTSYGYNEADLTPFYENRQCYEYGKLGLQGVSFLYSSGDYGVAGNSGQCIDPATGEYNNGTDGIFNPSFPGTCPYVTSVGATQVKNSTNLAENPNTTQPELAAESIIYSGGGFSNVFPMPSYQAEAVATYFADYPPPYGADRYNNSEKTRGYPDISANGVNYLITVDDEWGLVFGTSCSSPTLGSILTIINAQRLDIGKGPIGFINPTLYEHPEILTDITEGGNQGCGTPGFESVPGWDPVTGLGTPNFPKMSELFLSLP